jgi:predicted  nucleic acid-binding Zn-ribbon protein
MTDAECKKCGYSWETNSKMILVSCPSCGSKVKIREIKKDE